MSETPDFTLKDEGGYYVAQANTARAQERAKAWDRLARWDPTGDAPPLYALNPKAPAGLRAEGFTVEVW